MSNNNFNINERGTLYSRDSLGPIVQEIYTDILGGECLCGASGGIMDGGCICGSAGGFADESAGGFADGFAGGNDKIDGGAEFDLNVGYFGGDVDNLSDDECSDTSSDTSSDDEDADNVGGGFDGDFGGGEFDAIVGTYLGGSYIGASDLEIETTASELTELSKRSFSPDPETSRPESPVGSVSSVGSNASGTFMDKRGNKKSQSPTNSPTNSPLITTDDFGIVLSGVHTETPEETSITEQSDLIEHTTNETDETTNETDETTNETDESVTEQSDLIEDTTESKQITEEPESDDEEPEKTGGRLDNVDGGAMNDALIEFLGKVGSI